MISCRSMEIADIVMAFIGGGISGGLVTHFSTRKLKTYEIKLKKYLQLGNTIAQMPVTGLDDEARTVFNEALIFGSDEVASETLKLIRLLRDRQNKKESIKTEDGEDALLAVEELKPLLIAIRADLGLTSCKLGQQKLRFFRGKTQKY